jgi:hypothetical protein
MYKKINSTSKKELPGNLNYQKTYIFPLKNVAFLSYTLEKSDFLCNFAVKLNE